MDSAPADEDGLNAAALHFLRERMGGPARLIRALSVDEAALESLQQDALPPPFDGAPQARDDAAMSAAPSAATSAAPSAATGPGATSPEARYEIESEIAAGGSGRVLHVLDRNLERRVAMKVLRGGQRSRRSLERFLEEAKTTGQLEHPNIAPVYDFGTHPEHGIYFTMRLIRGRTLREILHDLAVGRAEAARHFTLTRLVQILQDVAMGVHYAHVRGVIHRDLKPDNIMVGDFGEVLVLDWGVAKVAEWPQDGPQQADSIQLERRKGFAKTVAGTVAGTISYMAPEQARGWVDRIDERTDVFGLGAVLYEVLTHHPPYEARSLREALAQASLGEIAPPRQRAPGNEIPASLEEICLRALRASKEDRYPSALAFHEDLQVFLDGTLDAERKRRESSHLGEEAGRLVRELERVSEEERALRLEARRRIEAFSPHDPLERKAEAWELADRARQRNLQRAQLFSEAASLLHSAISIDPESRAARVALAELYGKRLVEAEEAGSAEEVLLYRRLVERYHEGTLAPLLEDRARVAITSHPPGAVVEASRLVERGWRLAEEPPERLGTTPLEVELPLGDHVLLLRKEGFRDTRAPLRVARGSREVARIHLYTDAEVGAGFLHVPQGEAALGGDPGAPGSLPLQRRYVADFFVAEFPVTFRDYCGFLDDLQAEGEEELERWIPRTEKEGACVERAPDGIHRPALAALAIDAATRALHPEGFEWRLPVLAVSWHAAERYTRWLSRRQGRRVRLLADWEWERAARGASASIHPWGDRFDWSFAKGGLSRPGTPQPEPVGTFAADRSVYGVRDLAGSIREWCQDWFLEGEYRLTRGGSWFTIHEGAFRSAHRLGTRPENRSSLIGFRVAADPPVRVAGR